MFNYSSTEEQSLEVETKQNRQKRNSTPRWLDQVVSPAPFAYKKTPISLILIHIVFTSLLFV